MPARPAPSPGTPGTLGTGTAGTAGIVGLGLIGGSLARELAARGWRVLAHDRDAATLNAARDEGIVSGVLDPGILAGILDLSAPAPREPMDVLIAAVPVDAFAGLLQTAAPALHAVPLVMDVGSTKRSAVSAASQAGLGHRFVGAHPMAGDHRAGWTASRRGLFTDATVYLCRTASTADAALQRARALWESVGARPEEIDAGAHDRLVARTSHLPQVIAKALALTLGDAGLTRAQLGPGGRDMTRIAASDPGLWTGIALDNADELLAALDAFGARVTSVRAALERRDAAALHSLFALARDRF